MARSWKTSEVLCELVTSGEEMGTPDAVRGRDEIASVVSRQMALIDSLKSNWYRALLLNRCLEKLDEIAEEHSGNARKTT